MAHTHWMRGIPHDEAMCGKRVPEKELLGPLIEEAAMLTCPKCKAPLLEAVRDTVDRFERAKIEDKAAKWRGILNLMETD